MTKLLLKTFLLVLFLGVIADVGGQCTVTASNDTTVCVLNPSIQFNATASNTLGYSWTPTVNLSDSTIANPVATPDTTTTYVVTAIVPDNNELVTNGDFESGNTGFSSSYIYKSTPSPFSNNLLEAQYTINSDPSKTHQCFANCGDKTTGSGNMIIFNGSSSSNVEVWSQTITVQANTDYAFSAWLQNVTCPPYGYNAELQFSINGVLLGSVFRSDSAICIWKQFYEVWHSGSNTSANISIVNQYTSLDGNDFALDDISFRKLCPAKDTVTITIDVPKNTVTTQICNGDSLFAGGKYQKTTGTYYDTLVTPAGCDSIITTNLTVGSFSSTVDTTICTGDSIFLQNAYRKSQGSYFDTLTSANECDSIITTNLLVANNFTTTLDTTICNGDSILINGNYLKLGGTYYDTLSSSGICNTIAQTNLSTISSTLTTSNIILCGIDSVLFKNQYLKNTGIYFDTAYLKGCPDTIKQLNLTASSIKVTNLNFNYCPGDSVAYQGIFYSSDTIFYDTISNPPQCDSIIVTSIQQVGVVPNITDSSFYCDDNLAELDAGFGYINYLWSNGTSSQLLRTNIEGKYGVQVTDTNNCAFTDTGYVFERCDHTFFVPTSFSPNNDGLNDYFFISTENMIGIEFIIFDRWGEILFETKDLNFLWAGVYKERALPTGIYHWMAMFTGINREGRIVKQNQSGMITLIR